MNVALVLDRANDPTALLSSDWATRQAAIADQATIWSTYGADKTQYANAIAAVNALDPAHIRILDQSTFDLSPGPGAVQHQYITTEAARTIWVQVDASGFSTLFGQTLKEGGGYTFWDGTLNLPTTLAGNSVKGLWFDFNFQAVAASHGTGTQVTLAQGYQSPGNATSLGHVEQAPQTLAKTYYNFPLGSSVSTGPIGLIEPGVGTSLPAGSTISFQEGLDNYRTAVGLPRGVQVTSVSPGGETYPTNLPPSAFNPAGERSMDFGVVTAIDPTSPLIGYAGSGNANQARGNSYTAYQAAFWDSINHPEVITSSFSLGAMTAPDSPFMFATRQLYVDAALRGITVFNDNGDKGSGAGFANGLTNINTAHSSPFVVMVGGTSISSLPVAEADSTLSQIVTGALDKNHAILWQLIAGGLTQMPQSGTLSTALLVEAVWNDYYVQGNVIENRRSGTGLFHNNTASSGVDASQLIPDYQKAFGLTPTVSDPSHLTGRGTPDVSADAGGNLYYQSPTPDMIGTQGGGGTSAATPLWAALAAQINTIFGDQGLPHLGYMNDLLYTAAAIAPASFNDITIGNSISSFYNGGSYLTQNADGTGLVSVAPTGYGYAAGAGYDLVTGIGTPNGTLLARTLTWIAHEQISFSKVPGLIDSDGHGGWKSATDQALLVQAHYAGATGLDVTVGDHAHDWEAGGTMAYAWTARMAQQTLQPDFDPALVRMFDRHSQGDAWQIQAGAGERLTVTANGDSTTAAQAGLTSAFGLADFSGGGGTVHLARAVAVAETVGAQNDQVAIVRVRQGGQNDLSVTLYRVDDAGGHIGGLAPGAVGYDAAADARAYRLTSGDTELHGPGYGAFKQGAIAGVDAGDLVAMKLVNHTTGATYWAFQQANGDGVQHLWNYGANTWGWEDTHGGGDRDYNDLVVQIDFTSAYGHGWLT